MGEVVGLCLLFVFIEAALCRVGIAHPTYIRGTTKRCLSVKRILVFCHSSGICVIARIRYYVLQ